MINEQERYLSQIIIGINHYYSILHNINYRYFKTVKRKEANHCFMVASQHVNSKYYVEVISILLLLSHQSLLVNLLHGYHIRA